jgi:hypothetical protein
VTLVLIARHLVVIAGNSIHFKQCISPFCLLSPLPYSRKAVLIIYVVPRVQEVCRLVSTISHFGAFSLLWTLKYFASFVALTFAATTKKNLVSATLHFYVSNTTNCIQHNTPLHYYKLNMPKTSMCPLSRFYTGRCSYLHQS